MRHLRSILLVLVFVLSACVARQETVQKPVVLDDKQIVSRLAGPVWVAEYIHGRPVVDMSHTSMVFAADGAVSGSGGCNSFSGGYTLKSGSISFTPLAATMKMCAPALSEQEMRFFQSLAEPQSVELENGLLRLVSVDGQASVFAPHEMQ